MDFITREKILKLIQSKIQEQEKYLLHDNDELKKIKQNQIEELKLMLLDLDKIKKTKNITYHLLSKLQKEQNDIINKIIYINNTL